MTWAARRSPTRLEAASAPASTAARTLLTSPRTITLTIAAVELDDRRWPASTSAAFSIASVELDQR